LATPFSHFQQCPDLTGGGRGDLPVFARNIFWNFWTEWAVSDGVGNLIITPLVLSWAAWGKIRMGSWKLKRVLEGVVLVILLALLNYIAFDRLSEYGLFSLLLSYLTFPFFIVGGQAFWGTRRSFDHCHPGGDCNLFCVCRAFR
jgi:hypothetical protein